MFDPETRFTLTSTKYGSPGIYDAETRMVSPFISDADAQDALSDLLDGESPGVWSWREAYASEVVV